MDAGTVATSRDERTGPETSPAEICAAQHDLAAAAAIYEAWFEPVYRYRLRRLDSPEAARDATVRTFVPLGPTS